MQIEKIKLSQKKNGKGYISSYSVNISLNEVKRCGLSENRVIKLVDDEKKCIIIREKGYTLRANVVSELINLYEDIHSENESQDTVRSGKYGIYTTSDMLKRFVAEHSGEICRVAEDNAMRYLQGLSTEAVGDLVLLMYLGREMDCNMSTSPGRERFLQFYDKYGYIVCGKPKEILIDMLLEKTPLVSYLKTGMKLLNAPIGTCIDLL